MQRLSANVPVFIRITEVCTDFLAIEYRVGDVVARLRDDNTAG